MKTIHFFWFRMAFAILILALGASACAPAAGTAATANPVSTSVPAPATAPSGPVTLNVMVHDSFSASKDVVAAFEQQNNAKLNFIKSGDAGSLVNRAILAKNAPLADVMYGVDNTFLSRALDGGIYQSYASPVLADIDPRFKLDPTNQALPVDYGDVCINYDKAYFAGKGLAVPASLDDLLKPAYKGLLVMENPATSSPGLAFMLASVAQFGPDKFLDYWKQLAANGLVVVNDWETAYYTNFSGSSGKGAQPLVVSYGTSPAAEVVYATTQLTDAPIGSITAPNTCFRQVEFVGILKGTAQLALAQKFVDYMLSVPFQEDMPLQMYVYPANTQAKQPAEFIQYAQVPQQPATLAPAEIAANRDRWIQAWKDSVLK